MRALLVALATLSACLGDGTGDAPPGPVDGGGAPMMCPDSVATPAFTLRGRLPIQWQCWDSAIEVGQLLAADEIVIDPFDGTFAIEGRYCALCPLIGDLAITGTCAELRFATPIGVVGVIDARICDTPAGALGRLETTGFVATFATPLETDPVRNRCEY